MASIEEELLAELRVSRQTQVCPLPAELGRLDKKTRTTLEPYVADKAYPLAAMLRVFKRRDINVGEKALQKHRNQTCSCFKAAS